MGEEAHLEHSDPLASLTSTFSDFEGLSRDVCGGLLFDETTADVRLRVQDAETLPAHRAILGARSPVFRAMFFGQMKERHAACVEVNVFAPLTMRLLLRYIYAGLIESVKLEDMVPLMACADHYGVIALRDNIGQFLADSISAETACSVLALARAYRQDQLVDRYLEFILTHAQQVVTTDGFVFLDRALLMKILEADDARIEEIELFKALVRWYRRAATRDEYAEDGESGQASELFARIRYGQMTGQQLVTEVRPLAGEMVPCDLYVRALEEVAAPGAAAMDEVHRLQCRRRKPPLGSIVASDPGMVNVYSMGVEKVESLADLSNGIGIAIFHPDRNAMRHGGTSTQQQTPQHQPAPTMAPSGFPNPNQWGADCIVGIYGTGCLFGIITDHVLRWHVGLVIEVMMRMTHGANLQVVFTAESTDGERVSAEGVLSCVALPPAVQADAGGHKPFQVPPGVKLALALYSPNDKVSVEPAV
eukprot:TRINITY_DN23875_c0_g3_i3.p1 TRINITY_DN23875_c0_g3~~TRINITY_DN23875_c0_g3_i3.p1  ORF type:complete len:540 (-),score=99.29 TRINITY_DN23875_c0_g3_i3:60-1490(-)